MRVAVCVHVLRTRIVATGVWCDGCALPSVIDVELLLLIAHRDTRYALMTCCTDCGQVIR